MDEGAAAWRRTSLREAQDHGTWFTTANKSQASTLSLPAYAQLTQPVCVALFYYVHAFFNSAIFARHNYAHRIMHPPSAGEHYNYLHAAPSLEPWSNTQLQANEMRPRAIHHVDDTVLLFPNCPPCTACNCTTHCLKTYMCSCLWVWILKQRWHRKTRWQRNNIMPNEDCPKKMSTVTL